jgi:hypothetical protein
MTTKKKSEVSMEKKLEPEISESQKEPESVPISREEMPVMIRFNEFLSSISKSRAFLPETIGGFVSWMKREGVPKSLPFNRWKELLITYSKRIV